jgi:hypothetical protein
MKRQFRTDLFRREKCSFSSRSRGHPPNRFDTTVGRVHNAVKFGQGISAFFGAVFDYGPRKKSRIRRGTYLGLS